MAAVLEVFAFAFSSVTVVKLALLVIAGRIATLVTLGVHWSCSRLRGLLRSLLHGAGQASMGGEGE
jgi:hypothetical protein